MKKLLFMIITSSAFVYACDGEVIDEIVVTENNGDTGDYSPDHTSNCVEGVILKWYYN